MERSVFSVSGVGERDIGFLRGAALCAGGFVLALTSLFGRPSPFAAAGLFALTGRQCLFMLPGAALGYIVSGGLPCAAVYIAAMTVFTVLRFFFASNSSALGRILLSAACGICVLGANLFISENAYDLFASISFALVSGILSYCLMRAGAKGIESFTDGSIADHVCAGIMFVLFTAALTSLKIGIIDVGIAASAFAILFSSENSRTPAASVTAILSAAGIAVGDPGYSPACIVICITAPLIMLLSKYSRITRACVFIAAVGVGMIVTGADAQSASACASASGAAALYMVLPDSIALAGMFIKDKKISAFSGPFAAFAGRLLNMSAAVEDMRSAVIHTAEALDKENIGDISWVYNRVSETVCRSCPKNMLCWGAMYNETADIMNKAVTKLKSGGFIDTSDLDGHLAAECARTKLISAQLNRGYILYCSACAASRKIAEMRNVLTGQLGATGSMLRRMSEELGSDDVYDDDACVSTRELLTEMGYTKAAAVAVVNGGRLCIDAYCRGEKEPDKEEFAKRLSFAVRRELDLPMITSDGDRLHITVSQRARYDARIKTFIKSKSGNKHSGDCCDAFSDGCGNVYMVISDGMGSGTRARIDSAFACGMLIKFLKAGIDLDSAMEMINSSLLVKSSDESFATIDICRIELSTGKVLLCKAGGAGTYIRCGNGFAHVTDGGLPLGTGFSAEYRGKYFTLGEDDMIIMTSDGAKLDETWIKQLMMRDRKPDIDTIIETVGEALRLSQDKENNDDITVLGVKLVR